MEEKFLKIAKQAALEAGNIIAGYFGKQHQYKFKNKDKSDFATQADLEAEQRIIEILAGNFPTHNILAEESGTRDHQSEYTWVIDPLDGTLAFAAGLPLFAVSIALLKHNKPLVGVVYHVMAQELYWAAKGTGAYLNGDRIKVSQVDKLENASVGIDVGHRQTRQSKFDVYILPLASQVRYMYELGADAAMLALVGRGSLDAFATSAWVWDFAGGAMIVEEAGGKVTNLTGESLDWTKERLDVVVSNGFIHEEVLEALKK